MCFNPAWKVKSIYTHFQKSFFRVNIQKSIFIEVRNKSAIRAQLVSLTSHFTDSSRKFNGRDIAVHPHENAR